jgi:hypothetical protein
MWCALDLRYLALLPCLQQNTALTILFCFACNQMQKGHKNALKEMRALRTQVSAKFKEMKLLQSRLGRTMATEEHDQTQTTNNKNKTAKNVVKKRRKVSVAPKKRKSPPTAGTQRKKSKANQRENTVTHKKKPAPSSKPKPSVGKEDGKLYDSDKTLVMLEGDDEDTIQAYLAGRKAN